MHASISKHGTIDTSLSSNSYGSLAKPELFMNNNAPINGMPHLAYLGQMLEKGGGFAIGIFQGAGTLLGVSQSTQMAYTFSFIVVNVFRKLWISQTPISHCHTLCMTGRYGVFVRDM